MAKEKPEIDPPFSGPAAPAAAAADARGPRSGEDQSASLERLLPREARDRVKCVRVFGDFYRCNWWSPHVRPAGGDRTPDWATGATHFVRKSQFIRATVRDGRVVLQDLSRRDGDPAGQEMPALPVPS